MLLVDVLGSPRIFGKDATGRLNGLEGGWTIGTLSTSKLNAPLT